jgi:LPS-assembly protein
MRGAKTRSGLVTSPVHRIVWVSACLFLFPVLLLIPAARAQVQIQPPAERGDVQLEADRQRLEGGVYYAEGNVEIRFREVRLRADRVEYDASSGEALVSGNVRFETGTHEIEADEARYNLRTDRGVFIRVRGRVHADRREDPDLLVSPNPFYFEAEEVERLDARTYGIRRAWVTVCEPDQPQWQLFAPQATLHLERSVVLVNANFRLFRIPLLYLPYATAPVGRQLRQSGFLVPHVANTSRKGFVFGDSFFWAMSDWADLTLGAEHMSRRGFSHSGELRARPWEQVRVGANYLAVRDRGLPRADGVRMPQGGHQSRFELDARLPQGWRAAADLNQLSSLRFRLAFAETFSEAARSEVRSSASLVNNFRGYSAGFALRNFKNFLSAEPESSVKLRMAPGARFSSLVRAPWRDWPVYFGFIASADAVHRRDPDLETPGFVQRSELAPRVTVPLRWGPWIGLTPTFTLRTTRYGAQREGNDVVTRALHRNTAELEVDLQPPALARTWQGGASRWNHVVEPRLTYRWLNGVNRFGRFLRFDESDTLTDTNEVEYAVTQRFFRRTGDDGAYEFLSWRVAQRYYFDETFGGALVTGQRNTFQALYSITPFAFADGPRRFSPLVSDLRVTPGGRYDAQFRVDYDTVRSKLTAFGTLVKARPYKESFVTLAHFATRADDLLQPLSNQVRALVGYGDMHRIGWNVSAGISYDVNRQFLQNQLVQISYNGSCCGIGFEFRRLALGPLRSENQFRVALMIANVGTFGNLRRQEKIF